MNKHVLVTGANGFIGSHITAKLLQAGYRVTGAMRDPKDTARIQHLLKLPGADKGLTLVSLDLASAEPVADALESPNFLIHAASPFRLDVEDPEKDLLAPAVAGVTNILAAAAKSTSIERVVMTSSLAAVTDEPDADKTLTEKDWNTRSSLSRNPYYYSKTMAERAAWNFVREHNPKWNFVAINPYMVIGPQLNPDLNQSNRLLVNIATGQMPVIMPLTWGFIDVRDVADLHIAAMLSDRAHGRYLCVSEKRTMRQVIELMRASGFGVDKLPTRSLEGPLGKRIAHLMTYTLPKGTGTYIRTHLGRVANISTQKARDDLGGVFRPVDETLSDSFTFLSDKLD